MKFGLSIPTHGKYGNPNLLIELAISAENHGWDGVFFWDHIAVPGKKVPIADLWMVTAAVAARTSRIKLGPMVTILARRRPWKVAREVVTLDHISGGRVIFGVGLGAYGKNEFADFGEEADMRVRAAKVDEALGLLQQFWSGQPVKHQGEHFAIDTNAFFPVPVQAEIPIWVAGTWPKNRPMQRAARNNGVFPLQPGYGFNKMMPSNTVREIVARMGELRTSNTHFDFVHAALSTGDREYDVAQAIEYAAAGVTWWMEHLVPGRGSPQKMKRLIQKGPPR